MFLTEEYNLGINEFQFLSESQIDDINNSSNQSPEEIKSKLDNLEKNIINNGNATELLLNEKLREYVKTLSSKIDNNDIMSFLKKSFNKIIQKFKEEAERLKKSTKQQITIGIGLTILVIQIGAFLTNILLALGFSSAGVTLIGALIIAPLVEEAARFIANKFNAGSQFTAVFNLAELVHFSKYLLSIPQVVNMSILNKIWTIIKLRTLTILMQMGNNIIQDEYINNDEKKNGLGYTISVLVHFFWNFSIILKMGK